MYDRQTVSLWIHTTGEAVIGKYKNTLLKFMPSTVTTWKKWRTEHPETQVLNVRKGKNARFNLKTNPRVGGLSVGQPDGELKFYPFSILQDKRLVNVELAGKKIVVVFDPEAFAFAAFERGDLTFVWKDGGMVDQTGKQWRLLTGTSGELTLQPIPAVTWLTRAWKRFYPEGLIYSTE